MLRSKFKFSDSKSMIATRKSSGFMVSSFRVRTGSGTQQVTSFRDFSIAPACSVGRRGAAVEEGVWGRRHHGGSPRSRPLGQRQPVQQGSRQAGRTASHLVRAQVNHMALRSSVTGFSRYVKDPKMTPKRKELLIYMLERIGREDGGKITIIFDCQSAGVRFWGTEANPF